MIASRAARAIAITSLIALAAATPPQVMQRAPRPVMQNPNRPQADVQQPQGEQYTSLAITVTTGDDDLRSDSQAWLMVYFPDNSQEKCPLRTSNETWDNNTTHDAPQCVFPLPKSLDDLRQAKVFISYDGTPGMDPFHTQDNWNVNEVRIEALNPLQHLQKCLIDVSKSPRLVRMTGDQRTFELTGAPNSC